MKKYRICWSLALVVCLLATSQSCGKKSSLVVDGAQKAQSDKSNEDSASQSNIFHRRNSNVGNKHDISISVSERWKQIAQSDGDSSEKRFLYEKCINQLCLEGRYEDAIELINGSFEEGDLRKLLLYKVFANNSGGLGKLYQLYVKLGSESDKKSAASGIVGAIATLRDLNDIALLELKHLGPEGAAMMQRGLLLYLEACNMKGSDKNKAVDEVLASIQRLKSASIFGSELENQLLLEMSGLMPFELWDSINNSGRTNLEPILLQTIARNMAGVNPAKAMELVIQNEEAIGTREVFLRWLNFNSKEAKAWYAAHADNLSEGAKLQISTSFALRAKNLGDYSEARTIAATFSDVHERQKLEGQIWMAERDSLHKQVGKDPAGTIQALVSDKSKYDDYWLEEAMKTWIVKDFDNAQGWYQQNWQTLPANKAQYVAAAFATHAVKQGDTTTARQWVGYIQNPKIKQRVEAGIAKAEHADSQQ